MVEEYICKKVRGPDSMKCMHMISRDRDHSDFSQLLKKHTLNPKFTLFCINFMLKKPCLKFPKSAI